MYPTRGPITHIKLLNWSQGNGNDELYSCFDFFAHEVQAERNQVIAGRLQMQ